MRAHLNVAVRGLKNLTTANDRRILDASKPFEPFGLNQWWVRDFIWGIQKSPANN